MYYKKSYKCKKTFNLDIFENYLVDARIYGLDSRREKYKTVAIKDYEKLKRKVMNIFNLYDWGTLPNYIFNEELEFFINRCMERAFKLGIEGK